MKVVLVKEKGYDKNGAVVKTVLLGVYKKGKMAVADLEKYIKGRGADPKSDPKNFAPSVHDIGFIELPDGRRFDYEIIDCADGIPIMKYLG